MLFVERGWGGVDQILLELSGHRYIVWSFWWGHVNFQTRKYFQRVDLFLCKLKKTIVVIFGVQKLTT
jgi:hypothetical protein